MTPDPLRQMHVVVNAQSLQTSSSRQRGIGRYARNLLRAIAQTRPDWRIEAVINAALPEPDASALAGIPVRRFQPLLPADVLTRDANERFFGDWLTTLGADVVLELSFFEDYALVPRFTSPRPWLAGVAYDLIPLVFHEHYLSDPATLATYGERLRQFAAADLVLAISEATRKDVLRLLNWPEARVVTILGAPEPHTGTDAQPPERIAQTLSELGIDRPFFLYVGGADHRKNLRGTLAAFAALPVAVRAEHLLVIVCALTPDQKAGVQQEALALGVHRELRLTNFVEEGALQALYETCRLSLFPSYYEGLGLPVLEALLCGAPVVASNRSAIPEFAGPLSRLADPSSPAAIAAAISGTLSEPREERIDERRRFAAGFEWPRTAGLATDAIEAAVRRPRVRPGAHLRVAWVSPLPPARSGIADYSAEMLGRLPQDLDIELVISPEAALASELATRFRVLRPRDVPARHQDAPFDLFVYHIGNSELHIYMLDLLRRYAGLTVLHDLHLGGLALRADAVGAWPGALAADVEAEGAIGLAAALRRGEGDHQRIVDEVSFARRFIEMSEAVVVHSAWSWKGVRSGSVRAGTPLYAIPMGVPVLAQEPLPAIRSRLGLHPEDFIVVTLGEVTAAKRIDRLIRAAGALPQRILARLQLLVVGEASESSRRDLLELGRDMDMSERIRFIGRVPLGQLAAFSRAADACVQLRYPARGETSAALLRALAAGSACIVSDAGSFGEVPEDAALRVRTPDREVEDLTAALMRLHDEQNLGPALRAGAVRFVEQAHDLGAAAHRYAAAVRLTVARRLRDDGEWRDAACAALDAAAQHVAIDAAALDRWADVRVTANAARFVMIGARLPASQPTRIPRFP